MLDWARTIFPQFLQGWITQFQDRLTKHYARHCLGTLWCWETEVSRIHACFQDESKTWRKQANYCDVSPAQAMHLVRHVVPPLRVVQAVLFLVEACISKIVHVTLFFAEISISANVTSVFPSLSWHVFFHTLRMHLLLDVVVSVFSQLGTLLASVWSVLFWTLFEHFTKCDVSCCLWTQLL